VEEQRVKRLIAASIFMAASVFGQVSIGIQIGAPPPPRVLRVRPASPGADYTWVDGYWYPEGRKYKWHAGYWTRPPYAAAHWVAPHHDGSRYFAGYWEGSEGRRDHDHHSDRGHDRDFHHDDHDKHDRH
jgi:WXXGXW repeat (2 copies)